MCILWRAALAAAPTPRALSVRTAGTKGTFKQRSASFAQAAQQRPGIQHRASCAREIVTTGGKTQKTAEIEP